MGTATSARMWPALLTGCALYVGVLLMMARNTRYQEKIMHRLKQEAPLEDLVHGMVPASFAHPRIRTFNDLVVGLAPLLVLAHAFSSSGARGPRKQGYGRVAGWLQQEARVPEMILEFGALAFYKMCVCVATRLPPATQSDNVRTHFNGLIATSSWLDYGISGHAGLTILLWLHLRTNPALALAVIQSALMLVTRDHYTLDVMHSWVFCHAILGCFASIVE